jgi:diguanylate cyclase (GGDEF)-like protein
MEIMLKHLIDITCQRDHAMLDSATLKALHQLVGAKRVRLHELFDCRDQAYIRPRMWLDGTDIVFVEEACSSDLGGQPVSQFTELADCIRQRAARFELMAPNGERVLWIPIWLNDKAASCLEIVEPTPYNQDTLLMMEGILSVYRNYQSVLDYSERDSLTGLLNRKTFDEKFSRLLSTNPLELTPENQEERRHHANSGLGHWLAVLDIDHFKRVNDQFGHLYGDEVLILVANLLRLSFRAHDRVFRFGGEEFVVLLRSASLDDARTIFDRFRAHVEKHVFPQVGTTTISLGFASISRESPVVILGHADQALYYAKANGRNRICYYDELVESGELRAEVTNRTVEFF